MNRHSNKPNMIVDGIIYNLQKHGGISRIYTEILPRICDLDPALRISFTYTDSLSDRAPRHERIDYVSIPDVEKLFWPYRIWHPYYPQLRRWIVAWNLPWNTKKKIWLSTYYTTPPVWTGFEVVVVYDFIHEKYRHVYWQDDPAIADLTIKNKLKAIKRADLIICISESTREDLLNLYQISPQKTAVVHLAHNPVFTVMDNLGNKPEREFILYVGSRSRYKGFDTLLEAFSAWTQRGRINLVCAGGGDWSEAEKQKISQNNLLEQVILHPQVSDEKLCELYNQASVFIYPSQYEGFGIPLLEALACGCPVVASKIPSSTEVTQDIPFYFSPGSSEELTTALEQALNEGKSPSRKEAGLALSRKFSWKKTADEFLQALHSLR